MTEQSGLLASSSLACFKTLILMHITMHGASGRASLAGQGDRGSHTDDTAPVLAYCRAHIVFHSSRL